MRLEGLDQLKNPTTSSAINPMIFQLVANKSVPFSASMHAGKQFMRNVTFVKIHTSAGALYV
jgi:hypothetical protein